MDKSYRCKKVTMKNLPGGCGDTGWVEAVLRQELQKVAIYKKLMVVERKGGKVIPEYLQYICNHYLCIPTTTST